MDGITLSIFFGTALGIVGAWILISITESKLWKKWMSKLDLCIERTSEPKSELDREIADEEKEIKFLTVQKEKIDKLDKLKRKKDRLYQEVNVDAQNEDVDVYRCKECGSTKVTAEEALAELEAMNPPGLVKKIKELEELIVQLEGTIELRDNEIVGLEEDLSNAGDPEYITHLEEELMRANNAVEQHNATTSEALEEARNYGGDE